MNKEESFRKKKKAPPRKPNELKPGEKIAGHVPRPFDRNYTAKPTVVVYKRDLEAEDGAEA